MTAEMIRAKGNIMRHPGGVSNRTKLAKSIGSALLLLHQQMRRTSSRKRTGRLYSEEKKRSCPHVKATFEATTNYESFIHLLQSPCCSGEKVRNLDGATSHATVRAEEQELT